MSPLCWKQQLSTKRHRGYASYAPSTLITTKVTNKRQVREKRGNKFEDSGMTMEELFELQQKEFEEAKKKQSGES